MEKIDWGVDPSVRDLRRVFAMVEAQQQQFLDRLGIHRLDKRLGQWRKIALQLFEQAWSDSVRSGRRLEEKDVADLYLHCLAKALALSGIVVPLGLLPRNSSLEQLLEEKK